MNQARSVAVRPLQSYPWSEFRIDGAGVSHVGSQGLSADIVSNLASQFEAHATVPFIGLVASFPLNDDEFLIAYANERRDTIRCYVVPQQQLKSAISEVCELGSRLEVAPSIANLDRIEPLLRCATSGQQMIVCGCIPDRTMATAWQMLPPSCRHELTFASPPFAQTDTRIYFSPDFDTSRLGLNAASVILDLSKHCPVDGMSEVTLGWSIAVHSQLFSDNPMESLEEFYGAHCSAASLAELEDISRKWCEEESFVQSAFQMADEDPAVSESELGLVFSADTSLLSAEEAGSDSIIEQLGQLDDAVIDAIAGSNDGLSRMRDLWPAAQDEIPAHLLDESREHYLRYVVNEWTQRFGDEIDPAACLPTIEVMRILLGDK